MRKMYASMFTGWSTPAHHGQDMSAEKELGTRNKQTTRWGVVALVGCWLVMIAVISSTARQEAAYGTDVEACGVEAQSARRGQLASIPYRRQPYHLDSGVHENRAAKSSRAYKEVIRVPGVPWLRLRFSAHDLGAESFLTITSLKDGSQQRLDATRFRQWRSSSAYFNGDAVQVELHVAPQEEGIFVRIDEIIVGEWTGAAAAMPNGVHVPSSICGSADNRGASNDAAVGRITTGDPVTDRIAFCTGWIVSNGAHLSAGHCEDAYDGIEILELDVPDSTATGTVQFAAADDQYLVDRTSVVWHNDGGENNTVGNDWAVFAVFPNANTKLLPAQAQGAFYRMSRDSNPTTVRVTGCGVDGPPPCYGDDNPPGCGAATQNSDNQTLQTHSGPYDGEATDSANDVFISYQVDTQPASSGSPVIDTSSGLAIGIHEAGGCSASGGNNDGTSFENDDLEAAIRSFPAAYVVYVDRGHPASIKEGTVFRPCSTVVHAASLALSGATISIVAGSYPESITLGADGRNLILTAPVGPVIIGQ
jgi:hypothetical protein